MSDTIMQLLRKHLRFLSNYYDLYLQKKFKKEIIPHEELEKIITRNRKILSSIDEWIRNDVYENSLFSYGLPPRVRHLIDKPINNEITYMDVLAYFSSKFDRVNYLELGVSVGKNFFVMANYLENALVTGFDIEKINPTLEKQFKKDDREEIKWETLSSSIKKDESTLKSYSYNNNNIQYLCGDVFDEESWKKLGGQKFNIIFSDAFHSTEGLEVEYEMLRKYELIDPDRFVYFFDDLGGFMTDQFLKIFKDMKSKYQLSNSNVALNLYNGWLGQHENKHLNGIIFKI